MDILLPCVKCNIKKPITAFYDYSIRKRKKSGECKPCIRTRVNKSHRQAHRIAYFKSYEFKEKNKEKFQKYLSKHSNRHEVRMQTNNAIDKGLIVRAENCENCGGSENIEAHHDNYNYPLNIRWLCKNCHASWHCENTPIYQTH